MECGIYKVRPEYALKYLVQQVEEQSTLLDVTIKIGTWEKKFHRCVLVISPFFEHALNDNFLEKQTGEIKMTIGTPDSLQTAIMYLYGQKPKLSQENIENILQMAEFLLIPNLKSACITWLDSTVITEDNCLEFLQISSIYDFEIKGCVDFIEMHLPEMLHHPLMINLTQESVQMLFSDQRLSYVPMDDKLLFLFKWSDAVSSRKVQLKELLTTIDFNEVSSELLQIQTHKYADFIQMDRNSLVLENHQVLFMKQCGLPSYQFWCLDLTREQWFRFNSEFIDKEMPDNGRKFSVTYSPASGPIIWFLDVKYLVPRILMFNLQMEKCTKVNIKGKHTSSEITRYDHFKICGDICVAALNEQKRIHVRSKNKNNSKQNYLKAQYHLPENVVTRPSSADRLMEMQKQILESTILIKASTVYIGYISDGNVEMSPILSIKDDEIRQLLINQNTIAMISKKFIAIYDMAECNLLKIEQSTNFEDRLVQFENGFLIHDNTRCISLTRVIDPCNSNNYKVSEIPFENNELKNKSYYIKGQMWYRCYKKSNDNDTLVLETSPCHAVLWRKPEESVIWTHLPLPPRTCFFDYFFRDECFSMYLPKSMLRCHIDCPHCNPRITFQAEYKTIKNDLDALWWSYDSDN